MASEPKHLRPSVWVVPLRTPTIPPGTSTNTVLFVGERVLVVEPATPFDDERRRLDALLAELASSGRAVQALVATHHHGDHIGYIEALRQRLGVPVLVHPQTASRVGFAVDGLLEDGDCIDLGGGVEVSVHHTPGHAPGHLVVLERQSRIAHAGDMVAGEGFILIDPDDGGDMNEYLDSLARLRALGADALVPAHGPVIDDPPRLIDAYVEHRLAREAKVLGAARLHGDFDRILAAAYADTPAVAMPFAARSARAHLNKLVADGRLELRGGDYVAVAAAD